MQIYYDCVDERKSKLPPPKFIIFVLLALAIIILIFWQVARADIRLSEHFTQGEFACKCCGETKINMELIIALEKLRKLLGNNPIIITSAYRCPKHNQEVGGVKNSQHLYGNAVDVKVKGLNPQEVSRKAKEVGFTFTKAYSTFTHIDIRYKQLAKEKK